MHKLASLRQHLLEFPGKPPIDPGHLLTFADAGQVMSAPEGTNEHWELRYDASIVVTNFSSHADQLFFWVLQWLRAHQPDHAPEALRFEADVLNNKSADVSLTIPLTETVKVSRTDAGIVLHHADEPDLVEPILPAEEWGLYVGDSDPAAEWVNGG